MNEHDPRRTLAGALVALVAILSLVSYLGHEPAEEPVSVESTRPPRRPARGHHASASAPVDDWNDAGVPRLASASVIQVEEADLIERVVLEPSSACVGDQVRVRALLRPGARSAKVFVDGAPGAVQVVDASEVGEQPIRVLARSWGDTYEVAHASLEVRDCPDLGRLRARASARAVAEHDYVFTLSPRPAGEVRWDFGDGEEARGVSARHRYRARADRPQSTYLVSASYDGPVGVEETFVAVTVVEHAGIAARTPFPVLEAEGERFATWSEGDGARTTQRLTNDLREPVRLEVAEVRAFPCDGSAPSVTQLPAAEVSDVTEVPPGASVEAGLHVPASVAEGSVCQVLVRLGGHAGERLVTSVVGLDTGVPEDRERVEDRELVALLSRVVAERGAGPVTAEDLAAYRASQPAP